MTRTEFEKSISWLFTPDEAEDVADMISVSVSEITVLTEPMENFLFTLADLIRRHHNVEVQTK